MRDNWIAIVSLLMVLGVSCFMMHQLVDRIVGQKVDCNSSNHNCPSNVCAHVITDTQAVCACDNYKDALEILRNEQTNWLAVIGFFGVIFGLVVPVGSYLLQRQSLKDERDQMREEIKGHRVQISQEVNTKVAETRQKLSQIENELNACKDEILKVKAKLADEVRQSKKLMRYQVVSGILRLESSINLCRGDNWKYEWTCRSEIIGELIFILNLLRHIDDRKYVKERFKRLAEILREFKGAIEANEEWRVKEGTQTSDVRFDELKWCENECKADYEIIQNILHVLGIHVLDR